MCLSPEHISCAERKLRRQKTQQSEKIEHFLVHLEEWRPDLSSEAVKSHHNVRCQDMQPDNRHPLTAHGI